MIMDQSPATTPPQPFKIDPMPAEIAKAIVEVMTAIGATAITKGDENEYGGYSYASVDAFLAATNPACAKAGLIVQPIQVGVEKEQIEANGKTHNVMNFRFQFVLAHTSGKTWHCPYDERTIRLQWSGAQTSGMAQSYVLKQYMRALFQIATGDKDADADEKILDEAPKQIARVNRERKSSGKPMTSQMVAWDFGQGPVQLPVDEAEEHIARYLQGHDKATRNKWRAKNSEAMERLQGFNKTVWLHVGQMIEDGAKVA